MSVELSLWDVVRLNNVRGLWQVSCMEPLEFEEWFSEIETASLNDLDRFVLKNKTKSDVACVLRKGERKDTMVGVQDAHQQRVAELLTEARAKYAEKMIPQGDHAAAQWLAQYRHVKTTEEGKIYAYNPAVGHYEREGEMLLKADMVREFRTLANRTRVGEVIAKVQAMTFCKLKDLEKTTPAYLIPLENGVYNLDAQRLLPHNPDWFFTYKHPVKYDPAATCPEIQRFLDTVVESDRDKQLLIDIPALCLYRARLVKRFFVLVGGGHNGKSKYIVMVTEMLGANRVVSITPQAFSEDVFAPSQLVDRHANLGADIPGGYIKDSTIVKSATGGDFISVQRKGVDREDVKVYCEFVWSSNDPPRFGEDTLALWDRLVVIRFPFTYVQDPKQPNERQADMDLEAKITSQAELSGFLNLVLPRLLQLRATKRLSAQIDASATRKEYRTISDTPAAFVDEACEEAEYVPGDITGPARGYLTAEEAYRSYKDWCKANKTAPLSANSFGRAMEALGFEKGKDRQVRTYRGILFKQTSRTDRTDFPILDSTLGSPASKNKGESVLSVLPPPIENNSLNVTFDNFQPIEIRSKYSMIEFAQSKAPLLVHRDEFIAAVDKAIPDPALWVQQQLEILNREGELVEYKPNLWGLRN